MTICDILRRLIIARREANIDIVTKARGENHGTIYSATVHLTACNDAAVRSRGATVRSDSLKMAQKARINNGWRIA
jgi:hypothetical protein